MNIFTLSYTISCFLGYGEAGYAFDLNLIQPNNLMRYHFELCSKFTALSKSENSVADILKPFTFRFDPETGGFADTMKKRWPQPRWRYEKRDFGKTIAGLVRKYQMNQANMMSPTSI